ncbi:DUF1294 domain-containing protein [Alkalicoccobacillus gibsonii]|uniref:DUF1294 domain-containing protein n=1 Tax=Alkalicoccobacillus gibsonii TaxID=79881 RepID=UPI001931FD23|nr:DUF1294 domain-containing protein [Alkalicoccobacillus gibsonii]MBM0067147.1 DUF1294 domain-containing protein [Alkalicoccobacillus gibsonii]
MYELAAILLIYYFIMSIVGYISMAQDKQRAIKQMRRTPEKTLLGIALLGGVFGSFLGMRIRRHKTKHLTFSLGLPILMLVHLGLLLFILGAIQA